MWSDIFTKPLQGQQLRMMRVIIIDCPVDFDKTTYGKQDRSKSQMMINKNDSVISSQECVGLQQKFPPTILQSKDRPKIQNLNKDSGYL